MVRRRHVPAGVGVAGLVTGIRGLSCLNPANAFENRLKVKLEPYPKTPGPQPKDLGVRDDGSLKGCDFVKPNCFSSSPTPDDSEDLYSSYLIPKFSFSKSKSEAFDDIMQVLQSYEVGHDSIDGGGYKIVQTDKSKGYIYVQYESLKKGYIDDFEISVEDGKVGVRTASRLGFLDLRVNAKRLNYIAFRLSQVPGWTIRNPFVTVETHPNYFSLNRVG